MKAFKLFLLLIFISVFTSSYSAWYYSVYAEYVYCLAKHTQNLNQEKNEKFKIGVYGSRTMFNATRQMSLTKKIEQKLIYVENLTSLANDPNFQLMFIGKDKLHDLPKAIAYCKKYHALLVTDIKGVVEKGADVEFLENEAGNIKFKINSSACYNRGIKVSQILQNMAIK